jgi:hypothetical protein
MTFATVKLADLFGVVNRRIEARTHNMGLAKMRAAVLYLPCGVLCICRVLRHDSALNPALRQALKR